jgi:hypothetical protein
MLPPAPHMTLAPGSRISVYEVVEAVGAGGMGEVYKARDTTLGRHIGPTISIPTASTSSRCRT